MYMWIILPAGHVLPAGSMGSCSWHLALLHFIACLATPNLTLSHSTTWDCSSCQPRRYSLHFGMLRYCGIRPPVSCVMCFVCLSLTCDILQVASKSECCGFFGLTEIGNCTMENPQNADLCISTRQSPISINYRHVQMYMPYAKVQAMTRYVSVWCQYYIT